MATDDHTPQEEPKEKLGPFRLTAIAVLLAFIVWNLVTPSSSDMASSPSEFYQGKSICLEDMQKSPTSRPQELESCRWFDLAKFKIGANLSDEEIYIFFNSALANGLSPEEIQEEVANFHTPIVRFAATGHEGVNQFINRMKENGNFYEGKQVMEIIESLRKSAKSGDKQSIEILKKIED